MQLSIGQHQKEILNSSLKVTGKFPVITGSRLYAVGSCERYSKPSKEMCIPLRSIPVGDTLLLSFV